jgi:hypothetical protein
MKKTDIERIIKQGSTKQKIKLYFTDMAHFNTVGQYTAEIIGSGDTATLNRPDKILTDKERDIIFNSIKEPKDIKYWEELRTWNKAFLMFKPTITTYAKNFDLLTAQLSKFTVLRLLHIIYEDVINDILEVVDDKKLREKLVKKALESLEQFSAMKYQEKGFLPFITIPEANTDGKIWLLVEVLNEKMKKAKEYINTINVFLNKQLPLQPYKQFVKKEEDKIKANIEECRELIKHYIIGRSIETPMHKAIEVSTKKKARGDKDKELEIELQEERFTILRWEDIEVEVTDEDIEDIKNAGR